MYSEINTDQLGQAGEYVLSDVELVSFQAADGQRPKRISIRSLVSEVNVYEALDQKNLSGTVILTDAQNVIGQYYHYRFERIRTIIVYTWQQVEVNALRRQCHPFYSTRLKG